MDGFLPYKKMEKPSASSALFRLPIGKRCGVRKAARGTGHAEERLKVRPDQETIARAFAELLESVRLQSAAE